MRLSHAKAVQSAAAAAAAAAARTAVVEHDHTVAVVDSLADTAVVGHIDLHS